MLKRGNRVLFIWQSRYPEIMLPLQNGKGWLDYVLLTFFKIRGEFAGKPGKSSDTKVKWEYLSGEVKKESQQLAQSPIRSWIS